jgi:hypothetical protein
MTKQMTAGLTTLALVCGGLASPGVAAAEPGHHYGYAGARQSQGREWSGHGRGDHDDAAAAAIAGLAFGAILGAAISSSNHHKHHSQYGDDGDYRQDGFDHYGGGDRGYRNGYAYGARPRTCIANEQQWDDYRGGYVWVQRAYPC